MHEDLDNTIIVIEAFKFIILLTSFWAFEDDEAHIKEKK